MDYTSFINFQCISSLGWSVFFTFSKSFKPQCGIVVKGCIYDPLKILARSVKVLSSLMAFYFSEGIGMGINKVWGTFSVTVFYREIRHFTGFLLNSL